MLLSPQVFDTPEMALAARVSADTSEHAAHATIEEALRIWRQELSENQAQLQRELQLFKRVERRFRRLSVQVRQRRELIRHP